MKVGDRISEKGRLGTVDSFHSPGTVDVKFDDMEYVIRRQMHNIVALKSNPVGSDCLTMRYNGHDSERQPMASGKTKLQKLQQQYDELSYIQREGSKWSTPGMYSHLNDEMARLSAAIEAERRRQEKLQGYGVMTSFLPGYPMQKKNPRGNDMAIIYRQNRSSRKLTMADRARLPASDFVFPERAPGVGSYPINDLYHAKLALNMASWSEKGKSEMPYILEAVLRKYPQLKNWDKIDRYYDIADEYSDRRMAANPSKLEELKDRRRELMRIPAPGWGWMGPYAPWEKIQKDIKELSRQIEAEERRLEKKNPYEVGYPMRENWEWSDLAFWRKKGFQEGSAKAWQGTKRAGSAIYGAGQRAASEAAYQASLMQAKGAVNAANGRIKSLKSCAKELEVSDSMVEGTKSMQTARNSLAKAKKKVEKIKATRQEALASRKGGASQKQLPVAANPYRKRRNTGKNDFTVYHADHGIKPAQLKHIKTKLAQLMPEGFSIQAIKIPKKLGSVPNAMYGPAAGDRPVLESDVYYDKRGDRDVLDRMTSRPVRPWSEVQAIGIREGNKFTIFTIYGGPLAPQHPDDENNRDVEGSRRFWSQHALSDQQWKGNPRRFGGHGGRHNPGGKKALRAKYRTKHGPKWHANPSVKRKFEKEWKSR